MDLNRLLSDPSNKFKLHTGASSEDLTNNNNNNGSIANRSRRGSKKKDQLRAADSQNFKKSEVSLKGADLNKSKTMGYSIKNKVGDDHG